ncbi:hypothetical protein [Sphingomonas sp. 22R3R2A-7]|uniref:hypothetical protein n=1 Tax=Sphingomonas sp. 22R3R2A-7 TaxID=3050230 RepID=UPI002FE20CD3
MRKRQPLVFAEGSYAPIGVTGDRADHVLAFERTAGGTTLRVAIVLRGAALAMDAAGAAGDWWGDTRLATGERAADLFVARPVWFDLHE